MKILYSQLKQLVPRLDATPLEVGEALTWTGFMMDGRKEVRYGDQDDYLLSFEIRQNRADCLSVIGLAYEVAACFNLKVELPMVQPISGSDEELHIDVTAIDQVKRVTAIKIGGLKNGKSPRWLTEYLALYDINSISLLVDLSNYVMLLTGYPSHLIDVKKISGNLNWSMNNRYKNMTTLEGTQLDLKNDEVIISDDDNIIALAGIVGGRAAEIEETTTEIVAEVAIYNRSIIRSNARNLHITTEASQRLEKDIDPNGADYALKVLTSFILEYAGGQIESQMFDYYPNIYLAPQIKFKMESPSLIAGIPINEEEIKNIFNGLEFDLQDKEGKYLITPSTRRVDISIPEDLNEEVIRMFGYNKIPSNEKPLMEITPNITPRKLGLIENIKDFLADQSFDEILSWPLTKKGENQKTNYLKWDEIQTQNSVNEEYPLLRQTICAGLLTQLNEYSKKNFEYIKIFEIGKVFGKTASYEEYDSLGLLMHGSDRKKTIEDMRIMLEKLLRHLGLVDIDFIDASIKPELSNPYSCWNIYCYGEAVGVFYKTRPIQPDQNIYLAELNIDILTEIACKYHTNPVVELTGKLIVLDVNINLLAKEPIEDYLREIKNNDKCHSIFSISIKDKFPSGDNYKYTIRVAYQNISDQEAKKVHFDLFKLELK